jgi:carboxyl-terminal processing protease
MKDYGRAIIVGDDHTFGKGTVQSFVNQPGRLGAIKVTTALFFRPGGASTQHDGVSADIVLPSIFATDDLGERYTQYSLTSQMISPFLEQPAVQTSASQSVQSDWAGIPEELVVELKRRSKSRIEQNEKFTKISEQLAKQAARDDVIHLAELIREREEAEEESSDESDSTPDSKSESNEDAKAEPEQDSDEPTQASKEKKKPYNEEDPEPTPQREEAVRILADLVELQESAGPTTWHVPQSASRSELSSSQP